MTRARDGKTTARRWGGFGLRTPRPLGRPARRFVVYSGDEKLPVSAGLEASACVSSRRPWGGCPGLLRRHHGASKLNACVGPGCSTTNVWSIPSSPAPLMSLKGGGATRIRWLVSPCPRERAARQTLAVMLMGK